MKNKKTRIALIGFFAFQLVFVQLISKYPAFIEQYYSVGIYPLISVFLRFLFGWIPFSFGDVLLAFLCLLFLRFLFLLIKNRAKNLLLRLGQLLSVISILYFCFYFFWGLNYSREPLANKMGYQQKTYTTEELVITTKKIILSLNKLQIAITKNDTLQVVNPYTQKEMYAAAVNGYDLLANKYPQFTYKHASVKSSMMSLFQSYTSTAGYINPLTGEAQVNRLIPKTSYPATICHEMAHQLGWAAENEANFVGFLAAISNTDLYFKYSGYRMAFSYAISELNRRSPKEANELRKLVNKGIWKDFRTSALFWQQYKNPIEPFIKKGYSSYLKANHQDKGIESYNYVVDLLIHYFEKDNAINS